MKHSIVAAALLAGCSGAATRETGGPLPGETQDCGTGRYKVYDGSTWGPCEEADQPTPEQSSLSDAQQSATGASQSASTPSTLTGPTSAPVAPAPSTAPSPKPSSPTQSAPVTPAPVTTPPPTPSCFAGGDSGSLGCGGDSDIKCCAGALCINIGADSICAATCSTGTDCTSGCCVALSDGSASVCTGADACAAPPPAPSATYELTRLDRRGSDFYRAKSGITDIVIQTRFCYTYAYGFDNGLLVEDANGELELYIDSSSSSGACEVVGVYATQPPFGSFSLSGIQQVGTDIYTGQSGSADLVIETQLCLALPVFDDGVLVWDGVGSQLYMDTLSGDVCDVVNVYSN